MASSASSRRLVVLGPAAGVTPDDWVTVREAAAIMGSSPSSIRRLIEENRIVWRSETRAQGTRYKVQVPAEFLDQVDDAPSTPPDAPSTPPAAETSQPSEINVPAPGRLPNADEADTTPHGGPIDPTMAAQWRIVEVSLAQMIEAHRTNLTQAERLGRLEAEIRRVNLDLSIARARIVNVETDRLAILDALIETRAKLAALTRESRTARAFFRWLLRRRPHWTVLP